MKTFKLLSLFSLIILLSGTSCIQPKPEKPTITVSILPQKYFADRIVGNHMEVMCMVPAGSNPEAYDPSPNQLVQLNKSKAYLAVGNLGFELAWLSKFQQNHPELKIYNTSAHIPLLEEDAAINHEHVGPDPHIWSSPKTARIMARNIYLAIVAADSTHKKSYTDNYKKLAAQIDSLDRMVSEKLANIKNRSFLIYHPALTYLARDYRLNQFSVEYNGKEPTPQHIKSLISIAKKEHIKVIFVQKEFDVKNASILSKETSCRISSINPLCYDWNKGISEIVEVLAQE